MKLVIHNNEILTDRAATADCYRKISRPGPESCGCGHCLGWIAARPFVVTPKIRRILQQLGIPLNGEIEVWHVDGTQKDNHYGGWYMFVGEILSRPEGEFNVDGVDFRFSRGCSYDVAAFEQYSVNELHFSTETDSSTITP